MIRIEVEDYCQSCLDFTADVMNARRVFADWGGYEMTDTVIRCKYRDRCASIKRYLEQQLKGEK